MSSTSNTNPFRSNNTAVTDTLMHSFLNHKKKNHTSSMKKLIGLDAVNIEGHKSLKNYASILTNLGGTKYKHAIASGDLDEPGYKIHGLQTLYGFTKEDNLTYGSESLMLRQRKEPESRVNLSNIKDTSIISRTQKNKSLLRELSRAKEKKEENTLNLQPLNNHHQSNDLGLQLDYLRLA